MNDKRTTTDGEPFDPTPKENGQQKNYVILSDEHLAKGFLQPVRTAYLHEKCGTITTMGRKLAETYAREPGFYTATFCAHCKDHYPVGAAGEFVWDGTKQKVGT